jgi:mono/diheme cytochrome c family protein
MTTTTRLRIGLSAGGWPLVLGSLLLTCPETRAQDLQRGRSLYENHCQACHAKPLQRRKDSKIETLDDLRRRVSAWGDHAGEGWGAAEIDDVTGYLDDRFYHLRPDSR